MLYERLTEQIIGCAFEGMKGGGVLDSQDVKDYSGLGGFFICYTEG